MPLLSPSEASRAQFDTRSVTAAIDALLVASRTVPAAQGFNHRISRAEEIVVSTSPMQRLRRLRQMGLAYHAYPLAEHTRFSHSIGTSYWATRMLANLRRSRGQLAANNERLLAAMTDVLGPSLSLELLIRLYAILHDIALLPLGHTLRIQIERLHTKDTFRAAFGLALAQVRCEAQCAEIADGKMTRTEWIVFERHLALVEMVAHAPRLLLGQFFGELALANDIFEQGELLRLLPIITFVYDIVHGVYAADLIDLCGRDLPALGRHFSLPESLLDAGAVIVATERTPAFPTDVQCVCKSIYRYGIDCRTPGGPGVAALYDLAAVHRARLEIIQVGVYAPRKVIADAMLEKGIRQLEAKDPSALLALGPLHDLLSIGDDEFLDLLEARFPSAPPQDWVRRVKCGQLYEIAAVIDVLAAPDEFQGLMPLCESEGPAGLERELARRTDLADHEIIVSVSPEGMQGKAATTLVAVGPHEWQPVDRLARTTALVPDLADLNYQYRMLRTLTVLLHPHSLDKASLVRQVCRSLAHAKTS